MGHDDLYRCDRDLCAAETPTEAHASTDGGAYEAVPTDWIVVKQGAYGRQYTFCSWACAASVVADFIDQESKQATR